LFTVQSGHDIALDECSRRERERSEPKKLNADEKAISHYIELNLLLYSPKQPLRGTRRAKRAKKGKEKERPCEGNVLKHKYEALNLFADGPTQP
jgi:hypothetical protein